MKRCGWFDFEPTKEQFPIRVDAHTGTFEIALGENYDNKSFKGKDLEALRNDAYIFLRDMTAGKWEPYVIVQHDRNGIQHEHQVYLEYQRVFRLKKQNGDLVWKKWQGPDGDYEGNPGQSTYGPDREDEDKHVKCIPYSKEVWEGLHAITKAIETVDKKIRDMVAGADLEVKLKHIAAGTQNALGYEGQKKVKSEER